MDPHKDYRRKHTNPAVYIRHVVEGRDVNPFEVSNALSDLKAFPGALEWLDLHLPVTLDEVKFVFLSLATQSHIEEWPQLLDDNRKRYGDLDHLIPGSGVIPKNYRSKP